MAIRLEKGLEQQIRKAVADCSFPCLKQDVLECAQRNGVSEEVMRLLRYMPEETKYDDVNDVLEGVHTYLERRQR